MEMIIWDGDDFDGFFHGQRLSTPTPTTLTAISTQRNGPRSTSFNFIVVGIVISETGVFECIWCYCNGIEFVCNMIDYVVFLLFNHKEKENWNENQ